MTNQGENDMKDDDGWIEWSGGDCPVPAGALVDVRFRNGKQELRQDARFLAWYHTYEDDDIVAYRISKPAEPAKPDTSTEDAFWREKGIPAPDTSAEENRLWHGYAQAALGALVQRGVRGDTPEKMAEAAGVVADAMLAKAEAINAATPRSARERQLEELLRSACAIADRKGEGTAWERFAASVRAIGLNGITARTYRVLPSDEQDTPS